MSAEENYNLFELFEWIETAIHNGHWTSREETVLEINIYSAPDITPLNITRILWVYIPNLTCETSWLLASSGLHFMHLCDKVNYVGDFHSAANILLSVNFMSWNAMKSVTMIGLGSTHFIIASLKLFLVLAKNARFSQLDIFVCKAEILLGWEREALNFFLNI